MSASFLRPVENTELNQVPYHDITLLFGVHFAWQLLNTETSQRARLVNNVTVPAIVWQAVKKQVNIMLQNSIMSQSELSNV